MITEERRLKTYSIGLRHGCSRHKKCKGLVGNQDYERGYSNGEKLYTKHMANVRLPPLKDYAPKELEEPPKKRRSRPVVVPQVAA